MRVVIFGANGPTGRLLTAQALLAGHEPVAVTRRPDAFPHDHERLTVAGVDVHDETAVAAVVDGADAVLSALGVPYSRGPVETYSRGTSHIVSGMQRHGVRRLAVVSSSAVEPVCYPNAGFVFNRILQPFMTRVVGKTLYDDMRRMETLVRASGLEWTIVRLGGGLYELPAVTEYSMAEGHASGRFTARVDLAASMLSLLDDVRFVRRIVAITTTSQNPTMLDLIRKEALAKNRQLRDGILHHAIDRSWRRSV